MSKLCNASKLNIPPPLEHNPWLEWKSLSNMSVAFGLIIFCSFFLSIYFYFLSTFSFFNWSIYSEEKFSLLFSKFSPPIHYAFLEKLSTSWWVNCFGIMIQVFIAKEPIFLSKVVLECFYFYVKIIWHKINILEQQVNRFAKLAN